MSAGFFHRLTGDAVAMPVDFAGLLAEGGRDEIWDLEGLPGTCGPAQAIEAMWALGLMVEADASDSLDAYLGWYAILPLRNPALMIRTAATAPITIYRPRELSVCRLPRTAARPEIVVETLPSAVQALVERLRPEEPVRHAVDAMTAAGYGLAEILDSFDFLTDPDRQLVRLVADPTHPHARELVTHLPRQSFSSSKPPDGVSDDGSGSAVNFYDHAIGSAGANFDWVEPTVSHAFREPTAALGGRAYGERIYDYLKDWFLARAASRTFVDIVEVGGGLGVFARAFLGALAADFPGLPVRYTIFDLSPELRSHQQRVLSDAPYPVSFVTGDAQAGLGAVNTFDLLLCNEVIADFDVRAVTNDGCRGFDQVGAKAFVADLSERLRPGGIAFVSEYGSIDGTPDRVTHLNHSEFSVSFGELAQHAQQRECRSEIVSFPEILKPNPATSVLIGQQERCECLRVLAAEAGLPFPFRAYDRDDPAIAFLSASAIPVTPLFAPLDEHHYFGPDMRQFYALLIRKDAYAGLRQTERLEAA